jgi:hypothetical protein
MAFFFRAEIAEVVSMNILIGMKNFAGKILDVPPAQQSAPPRQPTAPLPLPEPVQTGANNPAKRDSIVFQENKADPSLLPKVTVLEPQKPKVRDCEEFGGNNPTPAFNAWGMDKRGVKLADILTEAERVLLEDADVKCDALATHFKNFGNDKAEEYVRSARVEAAAAAITGKIPPAPVEYADAYERFSRARATVRAEWTDTCKTVLPLIQKIADRLVNECDALADEISKKELQYHRETDERFGWQYVPSRTLVQLKQAKWRVPQMMPGAPFDISKVCESFGVKFK